MDVSQTVGRPLPTIGVDELTGNVSNYEMFFEALKRASPIPIGFEDIPSGAKGYYHTVDQRIALQEGMSEVQTVKTLIHEMAHQKLHSIDPKELPPEEPRLTRNVKACRIASLVPFGSFMVPGCRAPAPSVPDRTAPCLRDPFPRSF